MSVKEIRYAKNILFPFDSQMFKIQFLISGTHDDNYVLFLNEVSVLISSVLVVIIFTDELYIYIYFYTVNN